MRANVRILLLLALGVLGIPTASQAAPVTTAWTFERSEEQVAFNRANNHRLTDGSGVEPNVNPGWATLHLIEQSPTTDSNGNPGPYGTAVLDPGTVTPGFAASYHHDEPYYGPGGVYGYPVPPSYTGPWGLYNNMGSAYSGVGNLDFGVATRVMSGTGTPTDVANVSAWAAGKSLAEIGAALNRYQIDVGSFIANEVDLTFRVAIEGVGPTLAGQAAGTYATSFEIAQALSPISLTVDGVAYAPVATLVSYDESGHGNRHSYFAGGKAEVWEFTWNALPVDAALGGFISFGDFPGSVITSLEVAQVPEPATVVLLGTAGIALCAIRLRGRRTVSKVRSTKK